MKIDYGPPAVAGVKHLQYIGDDADYTSTGLQTLAKPVGIGAMGVWAFAAVTGNKSLKKLALGVSVGAFIVQVMGKPK